MRTPHYVRLYTHCVSCLLQGSIVDIAIRVGDALSKVGITTDQEIQIFFPPPPLPGCTPEHIALGV